MPPGRPEGAAALRWAIGKLAVDFPASFPDDTAAAARALSLRELLEAHAWVTPPVLERAVTLIRWKHDGPFIPGPALFLDYCEAAAHDLEAQRREQRARLAPPAPPTDDELRLLDDANEAAKLRAWATLPERLRKRSARRSG